MSLFSGMSADKSADVSADALAIIIRICYQVSNPEMEFHMKEII